MPKKANIGSGIVIKRIIICLVILSIAILGKFFDQIKTQIVKDNDIELYKGICEEVFPVFSIAFDNGKYSFSFVSELNKLVYYILCVDFKRPETFLESKICVFETVYPSERFYSKDNPKYALNETQKNAEDNLQAQSSLEYSSDYSGNDISYEKVGQIGFSKECNVSFNVTKLLNDAKKITFDKKGPQVLIYHTHTHESYLKPSLFGLYGINEIAKLWGKAQANTLKKDTAGTVVDVGQALADELKNKYGIGVIHNAKVNDINGITGAYANSLQTASGILKSYPSIKILFDLHRDGLSDTKKLRVTTKYQDKLASKIMFVVGTNFSGLEHPRWQNNLTYAIQLTQKLESIAPGITRPIYISKNRYNEHLSDNALIVEIGGDGNTGEEGELSARILAKAIYSVLN